jgi:beta-galactosidase
MDYAGESGIGHSSYEAIADGPGTLAGWAQMPWPWWISWCGDLDITGVKKPQSFYRDVVWERSPVEVMVHEPVPAGMREKVGLWGWPAEFLSWNWPGQEGRVLSVNVYSRAQRVRLELNGRLVGECQIDAAKGITATFAVPYEPGILKASALEGGQVVGTRQIETTGPASAVRVLPEHERVTADRQSLIYIPVEIVDAKGAWVPEAAVPLTLSVGGPAELKAFGTGNPTDVSPLQGPRVTSFRGRALAILRSTGKPGKIVVSVKGAGVTGASAVVEAVPCD